MSKKRSNSDNILLPEILVTPHGGYTNFTGEETILPSLEYFKKAEINKDRVKAIGKMLSLEAPVDPKNPNSSKPSMLLGKMGMPDDTRKFILGLDKDRRTCLYTVSSQYNDTPVASNKLFSAVPEQYGFIEVPSDEANIGDIAQFWKHGTTPSHATMITGHSPEGIPLISYSNGNVPAFTEMYGPNGENHVKENLIRNREITDKPVQDLGTQHYYRYVGSPKKHEMIERRYEMLKNGERIFKEGGSIQPRGAWDTLSMAEKAEMIGVAVRNGITNLQDIREKYNEFAEGGSKEDEEVVNTDEQYLRTMDSTLVAPWQLDVNEYKKGGSIHIAPSKRGTFTAAAKKHGKSAQAFASQVLAHPENYSPAMRKKANFARNSRKWKHGLGGNLFYPGGEITYGKPFYFYNENGQKIDDTLNYNATIPEVVIIPDSRKTPAQRNEDERFRQRSLRDYDEVKSKEFTAKQVLQSQKDWENSFEKQALNYAQAAATGMGIGADIVSGLPIYSSLKGASVLNRAETPMDYVEGGLWLAPLFGEAYQAAKPMVTTAVDDILANHPVLYQYPRYAVGKLKYGMDTELPTVYRKVSNLPKVDNGRVVISNPNNRFAYENGFGEESPIITNFSTDAPVRSHSAGNWDRDLTLAFPGKNLLGKNVISTQPSDTFVFGDNITIPIKDVTGFSGRRKELSYLEANGIRSISSPEAETFWESGASDLINKIAQARTNNAKIFQNRGKGIVLLKPKTPSGDFGNYANTIERLTRETFKSPTLKDYQFMDYVFKPRYTSEVVPKAGNFTFGFVNKNPIFGEWLGNSERRTYLEQPWRWENIMYDPLTPVESDFRGKLNIGLKPEFKR